MYISVPFCRTKCSYCNFASDVFSRKVFQSYVERVCADLQRAHEIAAAGGHFEKEVDSIYLGGGTPTLLDIAGLEKLFVTISQNFQIAPHAEITVECAPGTLSDAVLETFQRCGVNRVSLGVQSFIDQEAKSVGRLHTHAITLDDIARLRQAGISNINVDLIAGLPHQTMESWKISVEEAINTGAPHASVYMLEVDNDSRLGRELIAGGTKYHAHFVPDEDLTADLYEAACQRLNEAGIAQYEISNFAKEGKESRHNLKYWLRKPYLGFGVDAHSMLLTNDNHSPAVRFSAADALGPFMNGGPIETLPISPEAFLQEAFFLGLRLNRGVSLLALKEEFGGAAVEEYSAAISELTELELLESKDARIRLTSRGRLLSNEVFERFISANDPAPTSPTL
jgi:oxygen-independent coproporphyrinogen III oxidase